jgi:two-component system, NtrC family, sensor kinase
MVLKESKEKIKIPLFWKFTIGMVVVVMLFGSINVALVHRIIFSSLEDELQHRGVFMTQIVSQRAINYILFEDFVALNVLIDEVKAADKSIEYILVCDPDCNVVAHTFDQLLPSELAFVHSRQQSNEILTEYVQFPGSDKMIRDISIPLMDGSIGYLRLGLTEDNIARTLDKATGTLLGMILLLIVISLLGTFIFSYLVTSPVKDISFIAENLNLKTIREKKVMFASRYPRGAGKIMNKLPGDEIDILVSKFNEMVFRLQKAYDELEDAQKKLIQSEKLASIGTLASGVAHEVNNPLAGIMNCISRIKKHPEKKAEAEMYLELMEQAAMKMEAVIKNLLNFARKPDTTKEVVNLHKTLNKAVMLAQHRLKKENINLQGLSSIDETVEIMANANQMEQVFLNIILNGIDAIAERRNIETELIGLIRVSMEPSQQKSLFIIAFSDNGTGIPEENLSKVTDPFFTTKPPGKGTGLGLSVSLNIVRDHNGEMEIKSDYFKGTTIRLILPKLLNTEE